jgi:hypothetical protein
MADHDLTTVAGTIDALRAWRKSMPEVWYGNPIIDAAGTHLAELRYGTVDIDTLHRQLARHADRNCRNCDGSGVFYGNVAICDCVLSKLPKEQAHG